MRWPAAVVLFLIAVLPATAQVPQAFALFAEGKYGEAKRILQPLQNDPQALYGLARIALVENRHDYAATLLQAAIEKKSGTALYHFWLGVAYGGIAESANPLRQAALAIRARNEFERAVRLDPNLLQARFGLIDYYILAPSFLGGDEGLALRQAQELMARNRLQGHRAFARIFIHLKRLDAARSELLEAVREDPRSAAAHAELGAFVGIHERNAAAGFAELETAIALDPHSMVACFRIGELAATSGTNLDRGEAALRNYVGHVPTDDEPDLAEAHYLLGRVYEEQGRRDAARESYSTAVRIDPTSHLFAAALKRTR
jgi:tetratricopeptide (TPR) repeat protein